MDIKSKKSTKSLKNNEVIKFRVSLSEKLLIESRAVSNGISVSEYLRYFGVNGKLELKYPIVGEDVKLLAGTLNQTGSLLGNLARKLYKGETLTPIEKSSMKVWMAEMFTHIKNIEKLLTDSINKNAEL